MFQISMGGLPTRMLDLMMPNRFQGGQVNELQKSTHPSCLEFLGGIPKAMEPSNPESIGKVNVSSYSKDQSKIMQE